MKKRSMLAIASLATGFVVAAVTPSHAHGELPVTVEVDETLGTVERTVDAQNLPLDNAVLDARG
ncbi:hypothetical protein AB0L35_14410 [Streptomyces sp. NPDC052309]|uniref:hypothetical protein n=1 Tax=Streptomyces sp. NPDC052309 TaxID=3155421 RepID=UPI00342EE4E9